MLAQKFIEKKRDSGRFGGTKTCFGKRTKAIGRNCAVYAEIQKTPRVGGVLIKWGPPKFKTKVHDPPNLIPGIDIRCFA